MKISITSALLCLTSLLRAGQQELSSGYSIVYTGRTLGYYRMPDLQPISPSVTCPGGNDAPPQMEAFRKQVGGFGGAQILVATGDNFGPDLGARSFCNEKGQLIPKERSVWPSSDNVATFFRMLGFSAIVPGKLDFRYGPERLRQIARYLASATGPGSPVQMLASNLMIETTNVHSPTQTPDREAPQNYATSFAEETKFHLPKALLPYIRQFDIEEGAIVSTTVTATSGVVQTQVLRSRDLGTPGQRSKTESRYKYAWLCPGELGARFAVLPECRALIVDPPNGTTVTVRMPIEWPVYPGSGGALQPGAPVYVCASAIDTVPRFDKSNTLCSGTFRPQIPYLQSGGEPGSNPLPYAIVNQPSIVVFGVVDPLLLTEIGELHSAWRNTDPDLDTRLRISDPLEALSQVLETCEADVNCKGKRKILLAQAPLSRAQRISIQLRGIFDAVITQADSDSASGDATITDRSATNAFAPVVLVPGYNYSTLDQDHLNVMTQRANLQFEAGMRSVENRVEQSKVALRQRPFTGGTPLWKLMTSAGLSPAPGRSVPAGQTPNYEAVVVNSALQVMRSYCKADVAFLQHRDLFIPVAYAFKQPSPAQLQRLLDELLWKGDLVMCRAVTGKLLAQMKADSDHYDSEDQDQLSEPVEHGRGLDYLGMFQSSGGLVVSGSSVDPGKLYSIATTNYLGVGDTGYAELRDPSVPADLRLTGITQLNEVSALVCDAIAASLPEKEQHETTCRKSADSQTYFDQITTTPSSTPRDSAALRERLEAWADQNWASHNILAPTEHNPAEREAQNERVLSLQLDRADIGFQQNLHSLSESQQQNRFSGVQAAEPTAPERQDITLDWLLRFTSSGKTVDRFIQTDAEYQASAVRQIFSTTVNGTNMTVPGEPYQLSQPKNKIGVEAGLTTHLIPGHQKNVTGLKLLTSARFETQLGAPFLQFEASDGYLKENIPRKNATFGKVGLRYDGVSSWLEMGLQSGPSTQVSSLKLGPLSCSPGNIQDCVSLNGGGTLLSLNELAGRTVTVQSSQRIQSGVFFNARVHLPILYKHFDYVIENSGSLFFNRTGDSSADTRYLEVMTHSVSVPVIGNLSIVPKVEVFLFQNKQAGWHIHGYQTSVTAQYRFDWHTGLRWGQAFRYPNPPQTNGR